MANELYLLSYINNKWNGIIEENVSADRIKELTQCTIDKFLAYKMTGIVEFYDLYIRVKGGLGGNFSIIYVDESGSMKIRTLKSFSDFFDIQNIIEKYKGYIVDEAFSVNLSNLISKK